MLGKTVNPVAAASEKLPDLLINSVAASLSCLRTASNGVLEQAFMESQ